MYKIRNIKLEAFDATPFEGLTFGTSVVCYMSTFVIGRKRHFVVYNNGVLALSGSFYSAESLRIFKWARSLS